MLKAFRIVTNPGTKAVSGVVDIIDIDNGAYYKLDCIGDHKRHPPGKGRGGCPSMLAAIEEQL